MLARLQQITTLGLLAAAIAWAAYFIGADSPGLAVGGAMFIVFVYALVMAVEFAMLHALNRTDPAPPATLRQLVGAWWGEVHTAPRVFCWRQPFRANAVPDHLPAGSRRRGVVFVHGFICNRGLWTPMMRRLREHDVPFVAVNLEPVFGPIERYAEIIEAGVRKIEAATGQPPVIVAHSMGGLATRAWLDAYQADSRVHRVITIGTPHRGTYLGRFGFAPNTRQMRLSSDWQRALAAREPAHRYMKFICFYGHCDNIVFPASTATLPGAENRHIAGIAHVHMAHHDDVFKEVMRWVGSSKESPSRGADSSATVAR